ncbi:hypothetical protein ASG65_21485 [Bacillus sp. Leaf13]|nr:hypothetical protein ASG65_21485 [Bacillus sp. Leaf13]KRF60655.1 hypothetical protein ASG99_26225 [Bacillus sp. Soil768D1]
MKMNKRKLASLIASLGLTSSVLVGCGSTPSVNKSDEKYKEDEEQNDSSSSSGSGSSSNTNTNSNSHTVVPPVTGSKTTKNGVVSGSSKASKGSTGIGSGKGGASS